MANSSIIELHEQKIQVTHVTNDAASIVVFQDKLNTWLATQTTDNITEGVDNKYFTATEKAFSLDRANHTGTQTTDTIADIGTAATLNVAAPGEEAAFNMAVRGDDPRLDIAALNIPPALTQQDVKSLYEGNPDTNPFTDSMVSAVGSAIKEGVEAQLLFMKEYQETVKNHGVVGSNVLLDWSQGGTQILEFSEATHIDSRDDMTTAVGKSLQLIMINAGSFPVTFSGKFMFNDGVAPRFSPLRDRIVLFTEDGGATIDLITGAYGMRPEQH